MTAVIQTPEQLLASAPKFHRGLDTPMRREASRTITYTWATGEGNLWRNAEQHNAPSEVVPFFAVLTVTHHKKHRCPAHYGATLRQHHGEGASMCIFDGRNGLSIATDVNGAGRYNANKLAAFAEYALEQLQGPKSADPAVLAYFRPERI